MHCFWCMDEDGLFEQCMEIARPCPVPVLTMKWRLRQERSWCFASTRRICTS